MEWESDYRYEPRPVFEERFRCLPFSRYIKPHLQTGDKIIMPPSSLARIVSLQIEYPLSFMIEGFSSNKISHCGVLQFDAEEGFVYMPGWMMKNLNLREGAFVILRYAALPRGEYMKLQPHTASFIELTNPKAVLEKTMRGFSCLSRGDTIMFKHGSRDFYLDVLEVGPGDTVSLIGTDCRLDFAPPLDYKKPKIMREVDRGEKEEKGRVEKVDRGKKDEEGKMFQPFMGRGLRLDGEAAAAEVGGGCSAVVECKKEGGKEEFKPFLGRSYVLGGI